RILLIRAIRGLLSCLPAPVANAVYKQIRGTCRRLGSPDGRRVIPLRIGGRMSLDLSDYTQRAIYYCGFYEPAVVACLSRYVTPGGTFVDGGANVGYYTLWASRRVGDTGRVVSFEPNRKSFEQLNLNVQLNGLRNVSLHNSAL